MLPTSKKEEEEILVDDLEYLLLVMWDKNLFCVYVVNDFYVYILMML